MNLNKENLKESFNRKLATFKKLDRTRQLFVTLVILVSIPVTVYLVSSFALYLSRAAGASVFFSPATSSTPPEVAHDVMIDSGNTEVAFARVDVLFDPSKIRLSRAVEPRSNLNQVLELSTPEEANSTGRITIALYAPLGEDVDLPSGNFPFASLHFTSNTEQSTEAQLTIDTELTQLVDSDEVEFSINTSSATITVNPSTSPTNTPTQAPTSTPVPTTTQTPVADTTLSLVTDNTNPFLGQTGFIDVNIDTGQNFVLGVEIDVDFDPNRIEVLDIVPGDFFSGPASTDKVIDNSNGRVSLTVLTPPGTSARQGTGTVATITYSAENSGTTSLDFASTTLVAAAGESNNVLESTNGLTLNIQAFILGDINRDGRVNLQDYIILFENFGRTTDQSGTDTGADLNGDGIINLLDYVILFDNFGRSV